MPFVLAGVCWGCVNLLISDGAKTALIGGSLSRWGEGGVGGYEIFEKYLNPPKSHSLYIGLLTNF